MDFTQMPVSHKYLLVMTDTFTGQTEGFPTWTEKAEDKGSNLKKKEKKERKNTTPRNHSKIWPTQVITK